MMSPVHAERMSLYKRYGRQPHTRDVTQPYRRQDISGDHMLDDDVQAMCYGMSFVFQIPNACYARRSLACARSLHANGRGFSVALRNVLDSTVWDLKLHMYVYSCVIAIVSPFTRVRARIGDTNWGGSSLALGYMLDATVKILYCTCCTCAHTCGRVSLACAHRLLLMVEDLLLHLETYFIYIIIYIYIYILYI